MKEMGLWKLSGSLMKGAWERSFCVDSSLAHSPPWFHVRRNVYSRVTPVAVSGCLPPCV